MSRTQVRSTKSALFFSIVSLFLCFAMLLGTTLAWFTDSVTSTGNKIEAGTLKVDLWHLYKDNWVSLKTETQHKIFNYDKWEPGYTRVETLKVENQGTLALKYMLALEVAYGSPVVGENGENLADVIEVYTSTTEGNETSWSAITASANWTKKGTLAEVLKAPTEFLAGELLAQKSQTLRIALHMQETAGNEYQNLSIGNVFVSLVATQLASEDDSFDNTYDQDATLPGFSGSAAVSLLVDVDENGYTKAEATATGEGGVKLTVPAGTKVTGNRLTLNVDKLATTSSNIQLQEGQNLYAYDIHVNGIAEDNTTPVGIYVPELAVPGLNRGNYDLYHVEDGVTNAMTYSSNNDLTVHNNFGYDPATGDVSMGLAGFSEVAVVSEPAKWEGNRDYSWYTNAVAPVDGEATADYYFIANADQLAALSAIVGGMNGQTQDSFKDKTVKLLADINLGDKESENNPDIIFYPIGYYNSEGTYERTNTAITSGLRNFEGTFDGNGHTVSNFYQNTWEMKGDHDWYSPEEQYYRDGMGLFGRVYGGTVKNLTVENFSSDGEIATTGVIAAYAEGATFENIAIFNCNPRVYNIGNGGIVGCVGWYAKEAGLKTTFKNITVDNSNKISALWGSYDVACGGIVGQYYPTSGQSSANYPVNAGIHFENCHIAAQMDVYNDVCANYQYYAYRYTGMLIGSVRENETIDGHVYPKMDGITASGCTVHFGDWNDYYYCELVANSLASYTHDHQFSRLEQVAKVEGTTITPLEGEAFTVPASGRYNYVVVNGEHATENATCYHFVDGKVHNHDDYNGDGVEDYETVNGESIRVENNRHIYLEFNNLVTGYGWGVTTKGVGDLAGVTILDREDATPIVKFESKFTGDFLYRVGNLGEVKIGSLFTPAKWEEGYGKVLQDTENGELVNVIDSGVHVKIEKVDENMNVGGTFTANKNDWTQGYIQFSGTGVVKVTIQDYVFCDPTVLYLEVVDAKNITSAAGSNGTDVVLLSDVTISSGGTASYTNCTVYGNGFTFNVCGGMNQYNSKQGHGIIITKNATIDNLVVIGDIYDTYGAYSTQEDYTGAFDATSTTFTNCYIANCATPIRANGVTIINTTLYGGTVANLIISGGTNTLTDVTTVNFNDDERNVLGLGILVSDEASETTKIVLNSTLKQYNYVYSTDVSDVPGDDAKAVFNSMFENTFADYHIGNNPVCVNTGIVIMSESLNTDIITDNAQTGYIPNDNAKVTFKKSGLSKTVDGAIYAPGGNSIVDNAYDMNNDSHISKTQGHYLPDFELELGDYFDAKDGETDTRYCYESVNNEKISLLYQDGHDGFTFDLTKLTSVTKFGISLDTTVVCKNAAGEILATNSLIILEDAGMYSFEITVNDDIIYGADGTLTGESVRRTYVVDVELSVKKASWKNAEINLKDPTSKSGYNSSKYYVLVFLEAIEITDYAEDGTSEKVDLKADYTSYEITYVNETSYAWAGFTLTITYTDGRVLTVTFDAPSGLSSPGASAGGKTISLKADNTHGYVLQSDGKINTKVSGTWPITKCTFKGANTVTVENTNTVDVTVDKNTTINVQSGSSSSGDTQTCLAAGTLITLADGSKKAVEDLRKGDLVMAFDHLTGQIVYKDVIIVVRTHSDLYYKNTFVFDDGTELVTINEHGIFDLDLNKYVNIDHLNYEQYLGHRFVSVDTNGNIGVKTLVNVTTVCESGYKYDIVTNGTLNYVAEDTLSVTHVLVDVINSFDFGDNLMYDQEKMLADIELYGLYTYDEWEEYCDISVFDQYNIPVMKVGISKGLYTKEYIIGLINTYVLDDSVQIVD